jgi:tetratricopeptide (TPR) repeat protein
MKKFGATTFVLLCFLIGLCGRLEALERPSFSVAYAELFGGLLAKVHRSDLRLLPEDDLGRYAQLLIHEYEAAPGKYPATNLYNVAVAYGYDGRRGQCLEILQTILKGEPDNNNALILNGSVLFSQGRSLEAIPFFKRAWANNDPGALHWLAISYITAGQAEDVRELLPALIKRLDKDENIKNLLAFYSQVIVPPDQKLFQQIAKGLADEEILQQQADFVPSYIAGFWNIGEKSRALRIQSAAGMQIGYDVLTNNPERRKEVIDTYEKQPKLFAERELRVVAASYMLAHEFEKAKPVYKRYLEVKPKDGVAWGGLAFAYTFTKNYEAAIENNKKGWSLGDVQALKNLAGCYLILEQPERVKELIPAMLSNKQTDVEMIQFLALYSMNSKVPDQETFTKALEGVSDEKILSNPVAGKVIIQGLKVFGDSARASILEEKMSKQTVS